MTAKTKQVEYHTTVEVSDWDRLVEALIKVESNGNESAVNPSGASGVLQLMECYVDEVNRIGGTDYTYEDRFDKAKSIEMFNLYNQYYNPEHDIYEAIRRHNPGAGSWYKERVFNAMK